MSPRPASPLVVAIAFLLQKLPRRGLFLLAAAFLVCLSRVSLGTHFVTDVLGGAATGFVAALIVRVAYRENSRLDRIVTGLF